jgi:hypothetical protein
MALQALKVLSDYGRITPNVQIQTPSRIHPVGEAVAIGYGLHPSGFTPAAGSVMTNRLDALVLVIRPAAKFIVVDT